MSWWIRPLIRLIVAFSLPLLVPAFVVGILWVMPGDPASNVCPTCTPEQLDNIRAGYNMTGPVSFYLAWLGNAISLDFGPSAVQRGQTVGAMLATSVPTSLVLLFIALIPVLMGTFASSVGWLRNASRPTVASGAALGGVAVGFLGTVGLLYTESVSAIGALGTLVVLPALVGLAGYIGVVMATESGRNPVELAHEFVSYLTETFAKFMGIAPAVILALFAIAYVTINYGPVFDAEHTMLDFILLRGPWPYSTPDFLRVLFGGLILGIADGVLTGALVGTRATFENEQKQRYIQIAILRGESTLLNALPNVLPALIGQFRGRVLFMLSGMVVVETVLKIDGIGDLLWRGAIYADYFLVVAVATIFAVVSTALLVSQAGGEILVAMWVRRSPKVPDSPTQEATA